MGFSRQEYWSGLPFPPLGDLPDTGMEPTSPACPGPPGSAGGFSSTEAPGKPDPLSGQADAPGPGCWPSGSVCASLSFRRLCSASQHMAPASCVSGAQLVQKLLPSDWVQQMGNPGKRRRCRRKGRLGYFSSCGTASGHWVSSTVN